MTEAFDRGFWEQRWSQALREHGDVVAKRPPNAHLTETVGNLGPGVALDAGCGHGSDTLWLAVRGWQVTAVDFAETALAQAGRRPRPSGRTSPRVDWVEGDLVTWTPRAGHYDVVACLYVHVAGSVQGDGAPRRVVASPGGSSATGTSSALR